jgi:hypothetical protein
MIARGTSFVRGFVPLRSGLRLGFVCGEIKMSDAKRILQHLLSFKLEQDVTDAMTQNSD